MSPERADWKGLPTGFRCEMCGDVIGVYEPLVHVAGGVASHTSRAAEPRVCAAGGRRYHLACYEALEAQPETEAG